MDKWQLIPKCVGCPASGGCDDCDNPRTSFPMMKGIAFSTRLHLLLAWNCLAGREERNEKDLSFSLLTLHGWFGFWVFFGYDTKSFTQAADIYWGFFLCAAQESNSLERQDWSSRSCPLLVLMQRVSCTFRKTLLPRLTLCAWRGWLRAGASLL